MLEMWVAFAFGSAVFAGITAILAKTGIKGVDSNVATALRTVVVLGFSWLMVFVVGSQNTLSSVPHRSLLFLGLSGLATGASWLCYFRALQIGDVNKVTPVDKSSTVMTLLLASLLLPGEGLSLLKGAVAIVIAFGTFFMVAAGRQTVSPMTEGEKGEGKRAGWFVYALLSAVFASLTAILAKVGISDIESNLGTAIRTTVVLVMAWAIVFAKGKQSDIRGINKRNLLFIALSGVATGASWLCFYKAMQDGLASVVVPIDKLSILLTTAFACLFLKEKLGKKQLFGLLLITAGTLMLLIEV